MPNFVGRGHRSGMVGRKVLLPGDSVLVQQAPTGQAGSLPPGSCSAWQLAASSFPVPLFGLLNSGVPLVRQPPVNCFPWYPTVCIPGNFKKADFQQILLI